MSGKSRKRKIYITPYDPEDKDYAIYTDVVIKLMYKGAEIVDIQGNHSEWEIINNISKCQFIWLVTENSVREARCTLEVMTVLERAFRQNSINAVLLMYGNVTEQLLRLSVLDAMDKIQMNLNSDGTWKNSQVDDILEELAQGDKDLRSRFPAGNVSHGFPYLHNIVLKRNKDRRSRFPAGNLSHGFACSHFFGFHNVVLDHFEDKIKKSSCYNENSGRMPIKIYELVPRTCQIPKSITEKDERVTFVEHLEPIEAIRAGHKQRPYILSVYKLTDNKLDYYFIAQFPNAISAMTGMKDKKLAKMDDVDIRVQLTRYYYTMDRLLNHPDNKRYYNKVRLLLYNDEEESPYDVLRAAVKKDLEEAVKANEDYDENLTESLPFEKLSLKEVQEDPCLQSTSTNKLYDACIVYSVNRRDIAIALKIEQALKQRHIKLYIREISNSDKAADQSLREAFEESRWIILVLSKDALRDRSFQEPSWIASAVNTSKSVMVILVLIDVTLEDIPAMLNWLLYLPLQPDQPKQFKQEMDSLRNYIKGTNIEISFENHLPDGDVGYGLAWGYALNYLTIVLKDFTELIPRAFQKKGITDKTVPHKLYIMVPKTCKATGLLDQYKRVDHCFKLGTIIDERAGATMVKTLDVYAVTDDNGKMYHFVGQFPAAVTCLYEMMNMKTAGLNYDSMKRETRNFCITMCQIMEKVIGPAMASRCHFLDFDDTVPTGLADVLIPKILQHTNKNR